MHLQHAGYSHSRHSEKFDVISLVHPICVCFTFSEMSSSGRPTPQITCWLPVFLPRRVTNLRFSPSKNHSFPPSSNRHLAYIFSPCYWQAALTQTLGKDAEREGPLCGTGMQSVDKVGLRSIPRHEIPDKAENR